MTRTTDGAPRAVLAFGYLGVLPFWSLPLAALWAPAWTNLSAAVEAIYAALILSFLGGARWGAEVVDLAPDPRLIGLAMTPTLGGLAILVFAHGEPRLQLIALAAALTLIWVWDLNAKGLPSWYGRLRTGLTLGAVGGLCVGVLCLPR